MMLKTKRKMLEAVWTFLEMLCSLCIAQSGPFSSERPQLLPLYFLSFVESSANINMTGDWDQPRFMCCNLPPPSGGTSETLRFCLIVHPYVPDYLQ